MYERFTDRTRKVIILANKEAIRRNHEYIGTEHLLMGLLLEGAGVAANVLKILDTDLPKLHQKIEKTAPSGTLTVHNTDKLPQAPRAKKVIEYAVDEARKLG